MRSGEADRIATPAASRYWSEVAASFAILPGYSRSMRRSGRSTRGANSAQLGGDPLREQFAEDRRPDLSRRERRAARRTYTLLPKRYALLPGASLVTPKSGIFYGSVSCRWLEHRARLQRECFKPTPWCRRFAAVRGRVRQRAGSARGLHGLHRQRVFQPRQREGEPRPAPAIARDSGSLSLHGNDSLSCSAACSPPTSGTGRGASVDIASVAGIQIGVGSATPVSVTRPC